MVVAKLEKNNNIANLYIKTHFDIEKEFLFKKTDSEIFRLSGTAINDISSFEGIYLGQNKFKAFKDQNISFEDIGLLSPENWLDPSNRHCYITELYDLDFKQCWLISKNPIKDSNHIFINLDLIDGGENLIKRYRISPFFGDIKEING